MAKESGPDCGQNHLAVGLDVFDERGAEVAEPFCSAHVSEVSVQDLPCCRQLLPWTSKQLLSRASKQLLLPFFSSNNPVEVSRMPGPPQTKRSHGSSLPSEITLKSAGAKLGTAKQGSRPDSLCNRTCSRIHRQFCTSSRGNNLKLQACQQFHLSAYCILL